MWALGFWTGQQDRKEAFESKHILLSFLWFFFVHVLITGTLHTAVCHILPQLPFACKTTIRVTSTPLSLNIHFPFFLFFSFFSFSLNKGLEPKKSDCVMVIYRDPNCV